ncbi:unnamed protein product [Rotaria sp. Silwood2]|nr:unnamed protein product [Rotaria sp. Silwood2]
MLQYHFFDRFFCDDVEEPAICHSVEIDFAQLGGFDGSLICNEQLNWVIKQFTEIYISSIQYPQQNYNITVNRVLKWKIDLTNTNVILVEPNESFGNCKNQVVIDVVKICSTM